MICNGSIVTSLDKKIKGQVLDYIHYNNIKTKQTTHEHTFYELRRIKHRVK